MSNQLSVGELKKMIIDKVGEIGLSDVLDNSAIEKIKNKIMNVYNHEKATNAVPDIIPESFGNEFPDEDSSMINNTPLTGMTDVDLSIEKVHLPKDFTQTPGQNVDTSTTGNIPAYQPELPSFIDKIEPAKVIIFSQNELSESGENLTKKPLRTFEDPDIKRSMNELWLDNGQKKAEVFIAKLEKIGELEFDYANGTTKFVEKRFEPDFEAQVKYKENPYMAQNAGPATPGELDINGQPNIMAQIASSVDIEKVVSDIVMNILRNQMLTNTTRAIDGESQIKITNKNEDLSSNSTQVSKPMAEGFSMKMIDLVNDYNKIDSPKELKEAVEKCDKNCLIKENEEVQEWLINGITYYMPTNKISNKKCYTK